MLNGINSPVAGPLADPEALTRTAAEGEVMGFDYLAFSDQHRALRASRAWARA